MDGPQKNVLVTGAGKRIGRAIALDLARRGWAVAVHFNGSAAGAAAVVGEITAAGGKAVALQANLLDEAATSTLVERAESALGPLDCLINNASLFELDEVATATQASWDAHMMVNLRAPFVLSQAFAQAFARRLGPSAGGAIINMIDQRVLNLTPHFVSYTVSKSGLWTLTRTLALALAPRIRVNGIGPGPTLPSHYQTQEQFAQQAARMPLGRATSPDEITAAVRFLLESPSITGQMLALDGGQHLGWAPASADDSVRD